MFRTFKPGQASRAVALMGWSLCSLALLGARAAVAESAEGDTHQRIDRLEAGVQAEEAIRAVKRLQYTYGHYLGSGLWSDAADLFTDNAVGEFVSGGGVDTQSVTGKANLRKLFMKQAGRTGPGLAAGQLNEHLLLQPIVTLGADGKSAKGAWHEVAMLGQFGTSASWLGGIYENEYVLEKGVWKISRLRFFRQYSGNYDDYGHKAPAKWNVPYHFEAAHVGVTIPQSAFQVAPAVHAGASPSARVLSLAGRVQRLQDQTDVENLQHTYGYYLDRKMWDDVADLFSEDGSLEVAQRGVYVGKPHIRRALEVFYGPSPLRHGELFDHINLATVVTLAPDGQSASVRTSQLCMLGLNGVSAQWEQGTYENQFIKQGGVWKVKAIHYYPKVFTDYDKGWMRDAQPAPAVSKEFPPDREPTQPYASYPKLNYVALHYANPVTGRPVQYPSGAIVRVPIVKGGSSVANATEDLATLERGLDAAIAIDAVENLNSSYGYYIDESAWDQMADTYASTGSKEITGAGVYVGSERIRKVLNLRGPRGGRTPNFFTIHQLTQPVIHISADGNSAKARLRLFQDGGNADGNSASWIGGIYENTAVKENGEWKFGVQELYHIFNASYRNGWARVGTAASAPAPASAPSAQPASQSGSSSAASQPANGREARGGGITQGLGGASSGTRIATEMPPDRPIRVRQYAFPDIVEPPFHYKNPVSGRMPGELLP
ncbi:MAG: nuclear transport factor 2 family protein [Gammaproteobacteria bacterium]